MGHGVPGPTCVLVVKVILLDGSAGLPGPLEGVQELLNLVGHAPLCAVGRTHGSGWGGEGVRSEYTGLHISLLSLL